MPNCLASLLEYVRDMEKRLRDRLDNWYEVHPHSLREPKLAASAAKWKAWGDVLQELMAKNQ